MSMSVKDCTLDKVLPGTVLGDNVHDAAGRVLLRAGTVMTESSIASLLRRGVGSVLVEAPETVSPEHRERERARLESRLREVFRSAGNGSAAQLLRQAALEFRLGAE